MENDKSFELMTKMYEEMQENFKTVNSKIDNFTNDISDLKEGQQRIENKLDDLEVSNANRHISMNSDIRNIKSSLSKVEIVTADNWSDIAKIKSAKRHRVK